MGQTDPDSTSNVDQRCWRWKTASSSFDPVIETWVVSYFFSTTCVAGKIMPNEFRADERNISFRKFAVIVSQYNQMVTGKLHEAAVKTLLEQGVDDENIDVFWVPGAWEIPNACPTPLWTKKVLGNHLPWLRHQRGNHTRPTYQSRSQPGACPARTRIWFASINGRIDLAIRFNKAEARAGGNRGNKRCRSNSWQQLIWCA